MAHGNTILTYNNILHVFFCPRDQIDLDLDHLDPLLPSRDVVQDLYSMETGATS